MNRHKKRTEFELGVLVGKRELAKDLTLILAEPEDFKAMFRAWARIQRLTLKTLNETEL